MVGPHRATVPQVGRKAKLTKRKCVGRPQQRLPNEESEILKNDEILERIFLDSRQCLCERYISVTLKRNLRNGNHAAL
ncbi:hypothetical protein KIN20_007093 [Parelaphostrongylus tenuis]|uniref:Uncharacterized protein n=1 Tax=Parelaphostrongylus tenuis TaxID=148309 RepID=A0AAD5M4S2_PARTN|nr:hypothetical protein KIN20_007093 [Parelaphostrongylus tenuis]